MLDLLASLFQGVWKQKVAEAISSDKSNTREKDMEWQQALWRGYSIYYKHDEDLFSVI